MAESAEDALLKEFFADVSEVERDNEVLRFSPPPSSCPFLENRKEKQYTVQNFHSMLLAAPLVVHLPDFLKIPFFYPQILEPFEYLSCLSYPCHGL
jgi:hypothetical protein